MPEGYACIAYKRGDILIGNIRPYLKKIWLADCDGGTNGDVLVVQIKDKKAVQERFLYHCLSSEKFFNYDDSNAKGAKTKTLSWTLKFPFRRLRRKNV